MWVWEAGFESQFCPLLAVKCWASNLTSLSLNFFYCKPSDNLTDVGRIRTD